MGKFRIKPVFVRQPARLCLLLVFALAVPLAPAQQRGWGSTWTDSHTPRDQVARGLLQKIAADLKAKNEKAAERDLGAFLKQYPEMTKARMVAAAVHVMLHRFDRALQDCDAALQLARVESPIAAGEIYEIRGQIHFAMHDYRGAHADLEKALSTNKRNYMFANDLAWFLATCPDPKMRDGRRAVKLAREASDATGNRESAIIDTLAAAEAEVGQFDLAVRDEKRAMNSFKKERLQAAQKRLSSYQNHQAWSESGRDFPPSALSRNQ